MIKIKQISLIAGIFAILLLSLAAVSAANLSTSSVTLSGHAGTQVTGTLTINNLNLTENVTSLNLTSSAGLIFSTNNLFILANSSNSTSVSYNIPSGTSIGTSNKQFTLTGILSNGTSFSENGNIVINVTSPNISATICKANNTGNLIVSIDNVNVEDGFGSDEDFWYPFDKISIDVNVENNGDWNIKNIEMKFCIRDKSSTKCILDEDNVDFSSDKFDLKAGKDKDVTLTLTLDSDILDEDNGDFEFYISSTGEIDDSDSVDDGKDSCASDKQDIDIRLDEEFVILTGLEETYTTSCGNAVAISGKAWNIDGSDLDGVTIEAYNKELGIDKEIDVGNIDSFDFTEFSTVLNIPQNASAKSYGIRLTVYDENGDVFQNDEDDDAIFTPIFEVKTCQVQSQKPVVSAQLTSESKVGENLVIQVSVTNPGASTSFTISPSNYESWAQLISTQPQTLTIASGQTGQFTLTLNPTQEGTQTFNIEAKSAAGETTPQLVQVSVAGKSGFLNSLNINLENSTLYIVAAIILILIIIVIALIVKVSSRKKSEPEF